jgi:hypothetical protein
MIGSRGFRISAGSVFVSIAACGLALVWCAPARAGLAMRDVVAKGQLQGMADLAVDRQGNFFVLGSENQGNERVMRFDPSGAFVTSWGNDSSSPSATPGKFDIAIGIAVDSAGNVYVADSGNNRVQRFSPSGQLLAIWGGFERPDAIAISDGDVIYVGDQHGVHALTTAGVEVGRWNVAAVTGLATAGSDVFVASGPAGVARLSPGRGEFGARFATATGRGDDVLGNVSPSAGAQDLAVDRNGHLWVSDPDNSRVEEFTPGGRFLAACGQRDFGPFNSILGVAAGPADAVYVGQYDRIARIGPLVASDTPCDHRAPQLTAATLSRSTVRLKSHGLGMPTLRVLVSEPARLRLSVILPRPRQKRVVARMSVYVPTGLSRIPLPRRIGWRVRRPRGYLVAAVAVDVAGHRSRPTTVAFRVVR